MNYLKLLCLILIPYQISSQNLVKNPSFEDLYSCSTGLFKLDTARYWVNPITGSNSTPDLYNSCDGQAPHNVWGFQNARTGEGYAGICTYHQYFSDFREYIQGELISPLQPGQTYDISFWISFADKSKYSVSNLGVHLSDTMIYESASGVTFLSDIPQVSNNNLVLNDTASWQLVQWSYQATGGERYLTIGNFDDDMNTTAPSLNNSFTILAYYYIDDVSVVNSTSTNTQTLSKKRNIKIFPNPTSGEILIEDIPELFELKQLEIVDITGRTLLVKNNFDQNWGPISVSLDGLSNGIYFLKLTNKEGTVISKKVIKDYN